MKTKYKFQSFLVSLLLVGYSLSAQSLCRQTISSTGGSNIVEHVLISQTIGQSYNTSANYCKEISYRPGFQQPTYVNGDRSGSHKLTFTLFPNPAINSVTVQSPVTIAYAIIQVIDVSGKVVYTNSITNLTIHTIDCQHWAGGGYVVKVSDGMFNTYSSTLIVSH